MGLTIGDTAPNFTAQTTEGEIDFHEWIGDGWAVLFSHPRDFTPVCTTELGYMASIKPEFDKRGVKIAIGSSSRNTPIILRQIGLSDYFDAVADGNQITHSKPDPEVFLLGAKLLNLDPKNCMVVEDADAGVEAALNGGMRVLGVGSASANPKATFTAASLADADFDEILK